MSTLGRRRLLLAGAGVAGAALAGCSGDGGGDDPADRGPIAIEELAFAAAQPTDRGEYEPQPDATYERGDVVWLYAEYAGVSGEPVDGDGGEGGSDSSEEGPEDEGQPAVEIDLHQTVTVDDPDGERIVESETPFATELTTPQLAGYYTSTEILLPGDAASGEYETTVTVTDRVSETEATKRAAFRIAN